jgi:hypothetical protein
MTKKKPNKKQELLNLHKEWLKKGYLPEAGLCSSLPQEYWKNLNNLSPTKEDFAELHKEFTSTMFWGFGFPFDASVNTEDNRTKAYTPLRQTLVLLLAETLDEDFGDVGRIYITD